MKDVWVPTKGYEFITISRELSVLGVQVEIAFRPMKEVDSKALALMWKVLEREVLRLAPSSPLPSLSDFGLSMEEVRRFLNNHTNETFSPPPLPPEFVPTRVPDEEKGR